MGNPITIFHHSETPQEYFCADTPYSKSYERLAEFAAERNIDLRFVLGAKRYSEGIFASYWQFQNGEFKHILTPFKPHLLYVRSRTHLFDNEKRVNNSFLEELCRDKYLTAQMFPEFVKKTVLLQPSHLNVLEELAGDSIVLKPRFGSYGVKVRLVHKSEVTIESIADDEYVAQEVIDSSAGIPGLITQRHEMRVYIFNGEIQSAYLRLPAENSFLANISQGASVKLIDVADIPQSFVDVKNIVDARFSAITPRIYTIDVMYEQGRPWVVELNDNPDLPYVDVQPLADNYLRAVLDLLSD